jgi:hypothetical protein
VILKDDNELDSSDTEAKAASYNGDASRSSQDASPYPSNPRYGLHAKQAN